MRRLRILFRIILLFYIWLFQQTVFSQVKQYPERGKFVDEAMGVIDLAIPNRLFFCTNYTLDDRTSLQFGLEKAGVVTPQRFGFTLKSDSIFLDVYQPLKVIAGRVDWCFDAGIARFRSHEDFSPPLGLKLKFTLSLLGLEYIHSRSRVEVLWDGGCVKAMHWEIDLPAIAGETIRKMANGLLHRLDSMIIHDPKLIVSGNRMTWGKNPWADLMAERNTGHLPGDIEAHRKIRIKTQRRKVENFNPEGKWKTTVKISPNHGVQGSILMDIFFSLRQRKIENYRFVAKKFWGSGLTLQEAQEEIDFRFLAWMADFNVSEFYWQIYPSDPPYDYSLEFLSSNPKMETQVKLHVLSPNQFIARIISKPDSAVFVRVFRIEN